LARAFDVSLATHKSYRILGDIVPGLVKGERTGLDIILHGAETFAPAHNPTNIPRRLQEYLATAVARPQDAEDPWSEGNQIDAVRTRLGQLNPAVTPLPYQFRYGLAIYLWAFIEMSSRHNPMQYRVGALARNAMNDFIDCVCQPPSAVPNPARDVAWTVPTASGLPANDAAVPRLAWCTNRRTGAADARAGWGTLWPVPRQRHTVRVVPVYTTRPGHG
jgi:hypothetical protein